MADGDWHVDGSVHVLRKRLRSLNLATGADRPNTAYGDGWELMADSTPISSIIDGGTT